MNDICGRDWVFEGGDHGDPGRASLLSYETLSLCFFMYLLHVEWRISSSEERILWCRSSTIHIRLEKEHQTIHPIGCFWAHAQRTGI